MYQDEEEFKNSQGVTVKMGVIVGPDYVTIQTTRENTTTEVSFDLHEGVSLLWLMLGAYGSISSNKLRS